MVPEDDNKDKTPAPAKAATTDATAPADAPTTSYEAAGVQPFTDAQHSLQPVAFSQADAPLQEGESRVDYMTRITRGSGVNRVL